MATASKIKKASRILCSEIALDLAYTEMSCFTLGNNLARRQVVVTGLAVVM